MRKDRDPEGVFGGGRDEVGGIPSSVPVLDAPVFVAEIVPGVILVVRLQLYTEATGAEEEGGVKQSPRSR